MNTFVIKTSTIPTTHYQPLFGKFIGTSNDHEWCYFAYRSHKVFKETSPDFHKLGKWKVIEDLKKENFDFRKNNICPVCGGLGVWHQVTLDKPVNGTVMYDEDGFCLFDEEINVYCVCNNPERNVQYQRDSVPGTYIGYLEHEMSMRQRDYDDLAEDHRLLNEFVKYGKYAKQCVTCGGDRKRTYKGWNCDECGLPGTKMFITGG